MAAQTLLLLLLLYLSLFLAFLQTCVAKPDCPPSSCGIITNISYPFRLNTDPSYCGGDRRAELECKNNVTFLSLNSHKYYVMAINYTDTVLPSIRVVDASMDNHTCSFPTTSAYRHNFSFGQPAYPYYRIIDPLVPMPINLISCSHQLKNSSLYTDVTHCHSSASRFTYVHVGRMRASDVEEACSTDAIVSTSWEYKDPKNVSLEEIHRSLLYGFELSFCIFCGTSVTGWDKFMDLFYRRLREPFRILLVILVLSGAVVYPLMSLIVAAILLFLLLSIVYGVYIALQYEAPVLLIYTFTGYFKDDYVDLITNIMLIVGPRFIISLLLVWLLIHKFRRRHLSNSDMIEKFLQSDNKLMPIRYSYLDIKKMTKNFQNKLGEGGYGSVYKGKLRSGDYVAVKMLGKSRANDQDFMNEIATIGRIHHVNIVSLVGYCVEGSKRALILDFMPNGSLEKHIFSKEERNNLNWEIKFGIVVGVARGIEYLHRGCNIQILHFDIKPHNILLDDKFIPKISDFGLAKFFSTDKNTLTLTAARGTIGYVAPELINRGIDRVSHKVDVYSFGMLLMEMVGLKRDWKENNDDSTKYFPDWIYDHFNLDNGIKTESIKNSNDNREDESTRKLIRKMTIVALWCTQMNPDYRPSINKVLEMLEGDIEYLQIPRYPLVSSNILNEDETSATNSTYFDSVSLLHHNNASTVEIIVEDFLTLP